MSIPPSFVKNLYPDPSVWGLRLFTEGVCSILHENALRGQVGRQALTEATPPAKQEQLILVSIIHSPPQEIVITGLTSFASPTNLASMVAFVMNVSGQPLALYWAEGVVFLADFVEPEALPEEYVKGRIYASNISHAPMPKYNNFVRVGNIEVPVIDVTSNIGLRDLARWIRENQQSDPEKS
jgi:hypothetical protein